MGNAREFIHFMSSLGMVKDDLNKLVFFQYGPIKKSFKSLVDLDGEFFKVESPKFWEWGKYFYHYAHFYNKVIACEFFKFKKTIITPKL